MKKTLLILLTTVACLSLVACYTTPEMDELRLRTDYESTEGGCSAYTNYMHEGLRNCIESSIEYDEQTKKTVTILPTDSGTVVVPRAYDDETMMDTDRIYERVDINDNSVEITYESAPKGTVGQAVTTTTTETVSTKTVSESVSKTSAAVSAEATSEKAVDETESEEKEENEENEESPVVVEETETVLETEIVTDPKTTVEAEVVAEPGTILEIEEVTDENNTAVVDNVKEVESETEVETAATDSEKGRKVTVVVKPLREDLVVSVDLDGGSNAAAKKTETSTVQTKKTTVVKTQKKKEGASVQEKTKIFKKNEKEVLPIEEK